MAFDEVLSGRIRSILLRRRGITERRMFGGLAFMVDGHMFAGVLGKNLMARVGPRHYELALKEPYVRPMDFTGKPLRGYVYVGPRALQSEKQLRAWVERCLVHARSLRPK